MEKRQPSRRTEVSTDSRLRNALTAASDLSTGVWRFKNLLQFMQEKMTIDELLGDRSAQAWLDSLLGAYSERTERADDLPMVILKSEREEGGLGKTSAHEHHRFQLADGEFLYYFSARYPQEDISKSMRPQDIVAIEDYIDSEEDRPVLVEKPFNKPINRVPISGGHAESYNYNLGKWEQNGQGTHTGIGTWNKRMPRLS